MFSGLLIGLLSSYFVLSILGDQIPIISTVEGLKENQELLNASVANSGASFNDILLIIQKIIGNSIPLMKAVDVIPDMFKTLINVVGVMEVTGFVSNKRFSLRASAISVNVQDHRYMS